MCAKLRVQQAGLVHQSRNHFVHVNKLINVTSVHVHCQALHRTTPTAQCSPISNHSATSVHSEKDKQAWQAALLHDGPAVRCSNSTVDCSTLKPGRHHLCLLMGPCKTLKHLCRAFCALHLPPACSFRRISVFIVNKASHAPLTTTLCLGTYQTVMPLIPLPSPAQQGDAHSHDCAVWAALHLFPYMWPGP
jgi:hypothetical protein